MIPPGAELVDVTFKTGKDTHALLVEFAAEQNITVEEYMRSVSIEHVYGKLRTRREIERANKLVEAAHGPR